MPTEIDIAETPIVYSLFVLTEHTLTGTRHIGHNQVEGIGKMGEILRIVLRDNTRGTAPLHHILG